MVDEIIKNLNENLDNVEVLSHQELKPGVHSLEVKVNEGGMPIKDLAYLSGRDGEPSPIRFRTGAFDQSENASVITRDYLRRVELDLVQDQGDPATLAPNRMYAKALLKYKTGGAYGTTVDVLTNFAAKGFKNDIDDPDIKLFYDTWTREIGFQETVEKIFFDFFRVGLVRTLKIVGKFDPKLKPENFSKIVNQRAKANKFETSDELKTLMAYRDMAAAKKVWSKSFIPLKYTLLDPRLVDIQGPLLFDQTETYLKSEAFKELRALLQNPSKQTDEQKEFIRTLPKELLEQVKSNKPVRLPPELVGKCDYRRQDYERWPVPRCLRSFDAMDYKDALLKADLSTLDGVTNYILKITIGNDEFPVTDQAQLETVARLFDTTSKSFDVVWNHTLQVEKVTFGEISDILGQEKFAQVNDDLTMAWGVTRAMLDGKLQGGSKSVEMAVKSIVEEVNFARRCVKRWIESEYEEVALAMGFDRYPQPRFDENALKDEIMFMSVIQGMIDRRIISYETGMEMLGLDFQSELANLIQEAPMVQGGLLGIIGSPYNPKVMPGETPSTTDTTPSGKETVMTEKDFKDFQKNMEEMMKTMMKEGLQGIKDQIQPVQRTPKGTPSEGRPRKGGATKPLTKSTKPNIKPKK